MANKEIKMANRSYHRVQTLSRELKIINAKVTIGASGAPTLVANSSVGVASITRDSAGVYIITMSDKYNELLGFRCTQLIAAAQDLTFSLESEDVDGAKTIQFQCKTGATETDPSSGSVLYIELAMKNSSVAR